MKPHYPSLRFSKFCICLIYPFIFPFKSSLNAFSLCFKYFRTSLDSIFFLLVCGEACISKKLQMCAYIVTMPFIKLQIARMIKKLAIWQRWSIQPKENSQRFGLKGWGDFSTVYFTQMGGFCRDNNGWPTLN